ncbi:hypothetical protein B0F90DRAFT_1765909 [Multifurca ochricompacta]|uniref:Uncharacterized protein n=1 Tax=Multifurca ochricompacta TaxID=376703 RepID=A0AAD4LWP6_9AGAM|nr:hypothetical protein B0F90DRAFT_1765909 [Multifurca ochricompacta]
MLEQRNNELLSTCRSRLGRVRGSLPRPLNSKPTGVSGGDEPDEELNEYDALYARVRTRGGGPWVHL